MANATIVCGNDIGHYAMIGAVSVVTKSVKCFELVVGNPANQIGTEGEAGIRLVFENINAVCEDNGNIYDLENFIVVKKIS